jgi:hypothetical protein
MEFNTEARQYALNNRDLNGFDIECVLDINALVTMLSYFVYFKFTDEHLWVSKFKIFILFVECISV